MRPQGLACTTWRRALNQQPEVSGPRDLWSNADNRVFVKTHGWEVRGSASSPNGSGIPTCPARRPHHFLLEDWGAHLRVHPIAVFT